MNGRGREGDDFGNQRRAEQVQSGQPFALEIAFQMIVEQFCHVIRIPEAFGHHNDERLCGDAQRADGAGGQVARPFAQEFPDQNQGHHFAGRALAFHHPVV